MCLYSLFILFCSLTSVFKKWNIETMLTPFPIHTIGKIPTIKMNKKRSQEHQRMGTDYVVTTGELIFVFWSFFSDDFAV